MLHPQDVFCTFGMPISTNPLQFCDTALQLYILQLGGLQNIITEETLVAH